MTAIVIDTNVLLVADGKAPQMSDACVHECLTRLERVKSTEQVVLDDAWIIMGEYRNMLSPNRSPTPGSAFLKWLLQVQAVVKHVSLVTITPLNRAETLFAEFPPDAALEAAIDPSDRKFFAASNAHPDKPPILEATDSKWLGWEVQLKKHGIKVEVLCRGELEAIRERKTKKKR
jgi:hypothetical protein